MRLPRAVLALVTSAVPLAACATASAPIVGRPPIPPGVPEEFLHFDDADVGRGDAAPDFELPTIDGDRTLRLSDLRGRPTVLVFGSHTCNVFARDTVPLRKLHEETSAHVNFLFVYVREAHATDEWVMPPNEQRGLRVKQPTTHRERIEQARFCVGDFQLDMPAVVDDIADSVSRVYGGFPDRLYVLDEDGVIAYQGGVGPFGFKPDEVRELLRRRWGF